MKIDKDFCVAAGEAIGTGMPWLVAGATLTSPIWPCAIGLVVVSLWATTLLLHRYRARMEGGAP